MTSSLSVIVPSYNGRQKLPGILHALEQQSFSDFELIVVLDGSTDDSGSYLNSYSPQNFKLKVIIQPNGGRSKVRNRGAKEASGDLLLFYDDDMRPQKESIQAHITFHQEHEYCIYGGNQLENIEEANTDFDRYRCWLRQQWLRDYPDLMQLNFTNAFLTGAHFSIPKDLFSQLEGFDEEMRDHEDRDLVNRALTIGISVFFDPHNIAWHQDFISVYQYLKRRKEYNKEFFKQGKINRISRTRGMLYYIFARKFWLKFIEQEKLRRIPRILRYKIYTWIIWGLAEQSVGNYKRE